MLCSCARQGSKMSIWLSLALDRETVRRSTKVGLIVGTVLVCINHGDALLAGNIDMNRAAKMILTYFVPYLVSTYASLSAKLESEWICKTKLLLTLLNMCIKFYRYLKNLLISFNFSYILSKFKALNVNKLFIKCLPNLIIIIHRLY